MGVEFGVLGLDAVLANITAEAERIAKEVGDATQMAGITTEAVAKQNCPVDTGRLRAGNQYTKTGPASCSVGNAVEYAPDVELGHRVRGKSGRMVAPRPFLFPGYLAGKKSLRSDLEQIDGITVVSWS